MAASKSGFMKDALILFAITLVSGLCLGVVYDVTKAPIEAATIAANNATYKQVLPEAESFDDVEGSTEKIAETADEIANLGFGGVAIESVLEAKDASGEVVGHVINSLSNDSYGGAVKLSIGFDADTRSFGSKADTLYNARRAGKASLSPAYRPTANSSCSPSPHTATFPSGTRMRTYTSPTCTPTKSAPCRH